MSKRKGKNSQMSLWTDFEDAMLKATPRLLALAEDANRFREFRIKLREDGTYLVIVKGIADDGANIVCFGVGYGFVLGLLAVDKTIEGNHWRVDKPYEGPEGWRDK